MSAEVLATTFWWKLDIFREMEPPLVFAVHFVLIITVTIFHLFCWSLVMCDKYLSKETLLCQIQHYKLCHKSVRDTEDLGGWIKMCNDLIWKSALLQCCLSTHIMHIFFINIFHSVLLGILWFFFLGCPHRVWIIFGNIKFITLQSISQWWHRNHD